MTACLYQITNLVNGKYYIGVHCDSANTPYMGSGNAIKAAIKKYGRSQFRKDILAESESQAFMYQLEAAVVDEAFIARHDNYNTKTGGLGGQKFSAESRRKISAARVGIPHPDDWRRNQSLAQIKRYENAEERRKTGAAMKGRIHHTAEYKTAIAVRMVGNKHGCGPRPHARENYRLGALKREAAKRAARQAA